VHLSWKSAPKRLLSPDGPIASRSRNGGEQFDFAASTNPQSHQPDA